MSEKKKQKNQNESSWGHKKPWWKDSVNSKTSVHVLDPSMADIQHADSGEYDTQKLKIHNLFQYIGNIFQNDIL